MERYFMGDATDKKLSTTIEILIVARSKEEAMVRYTECLNRHSELQKMNSPQIAEFWGDWDLVDRVITEDCRMELDMYFSVPVYT